MNANGIKVADHERIANELQQLLDEQAQLRASLMEQNVDPELIERIRHCVDTVHQGWRGTEAEGVNQGAVGGIPSSKQRYQPAEAN